VLDHNFLDILYPDKPVPDRIWIHNHHRPMLALVQATCLIHPNSSLQPGLLHSVLESRFQLRTTGSGAAWTRSVLVTFVGADKNMMFELCH
jgi:hypothetical protein